MTSTIEVYRPVGNVVIIACGMMIIMPPLSFMVVYEFWPEWAYIVMFMTFVGTAGLALAAWIAFRTSILLIDRERGVIRQQGPGSFELSFSNVSSVRIVNDGKSDYPPFAFIIISAVNIDFKLNYLFFGSGFQTDRIRQTLQEIFTTRVNES